MIQTILFGVVCWMGGALTVFLALWWHQRTLLTTPLYLWPVPGQSRHDQQADCMTLSVCMSRLKAHDSTRFAALWDSGLGKEFPMLGRN